MYDARNPLSDLEAIAAMPGLDQLAAVLEPHAGTCGPMAMAMFIAGKSVVGSANRLSSMLTTTCTWDIMRESAAQVGRSIHRPPTDDQFHHLKLRFKKATKDSGDLPLGQQLSLALTAASAPIVDACGLLPSERPARLHRPFASNVLYGDGTVFKPYSEVTIDNQTGDALGSRSKGLHGPRCGERRYGKKTDSKGSPGVPLAAVGVHGREQWQRLLLGVTVYSDHDEGNAAMGLFHSCLDTFGDRIHAIVYDRLLPGIRQRELMECGVVPFVDMTNAGEKSDHIQFDESLQLSCGTLAKPKFRAKVGEVGVVEHDDHGRPCRHRVWALDGALVSTPVHVPFPTVDSPVMEQTALWWETNHTSGVERLMGSYDLGCRSARSTGFRYVLELSGDRLNAKRQRRALADIVRPVSITGDLALVRGLRSDAESVFSTMKGLTPKSGRASSLDFDDFLIDAIGMGLHNNAVAWDVHGAQHTTCAKLISRTLRRREEKRQLERLAVNRRK
jgi:hypothetical protein